jgi:hypothetical protein
LDTLHPFGYGVWKASGRGRNERIFGKMTTDFTSERHERIYRETLSCLRRLGFHGQLLQERYNFNDWFAPDNPSRQAPAAAFGQTPLSYDSACFAVLLPDGRQVSSQILDYRALGAPFAMEVREDAVVPWRVGRDASQVRALGLIRADALRRYFEAKAEQWRPLEVLRAKNISLRSDVKQADVFKSPEFDRSLRQARVVLCNPPFEDFGLTQPARREHAIRKPAAVLNKVLSLLPADGLIGFVLPRKFIDGRSFAEARREVVRRFKEVEIVALPDSIFHVARLETCLLLGKAASEGGNQVCVSFAEVTSHDRQRFLHEHVVSRRDSAVKTEPEAVRDLAVPALGEVWERLKSLPTLSEAATIHRGVEWQQPFDETKYLSLTPGPDFVPGVSTAEHQFACFERPRLIYLSTRPEHPRRKAWDLRWGLPKVVMNAVRVSQIGPWKIAAFTDESEARYSKNFHCLWPKGAWTTKTIAALLNGPVAAAFVATRETSKHIAKTVLQRVPIPRLQPDQAAAIERLVDDYLLVRSNTAAPDLPLWSLGNGEPVAKRILLQIDAEILKAYRLPPRLERLLLDCFRGAKRPVPFEFGDYFPVHFTATIPLWQYISSDFAKCTAEHLLSNLPKITDPALVEMLENAGQ